MSDVLRVQLLAVRASALAMQANAEALITTIDVALQTSAAPEPAAPAAAGQCAHDNVEEVRGMGGAAPKRICLDCNREVEP